MKFYINQKAISFKDKFSVTDDKGHECFNIKEKLFTWGKSLIIYNANKEEIGELKEKIFALLPRYYVLKGGQEIAEVVKEITLLKPKYKVKGPDWEVLGNFTEHEYKIKEGKKVIAEISKKWLAIGDTYVIDVENTRNSMLVVAIVLAIDCAIEKEKMNKK